MDGDVLVLAQKILSKSEGRTVALDTVEPGPEALRLAGRAEKDPRIIELILRESVEIVRIRPGLVIARHKTGLVMANSGIDFSNSGSDGVAVLLPLDPDLSAFRLRQRIRELTGCRVGVVINDSFGRAWRLGTTGTAIGTSGIRVLHDRRGEADRGGRELLTSMVAQADEIAAAASLLMGQGNESLPFVLVRGGDWTLGEGSARDLVRPVEQDLFR